MTEVETDEFQDCDIREDPLSRPRQEVRGQRSDLALIGQGAEPETPNSASCSDRDGDDGRREGGRAGGTEGGCRKIRKPFNKKQEK